MEAVRITTALFVCFIRTCAIITHFLSLVVIGLTGGHTHNKELSKS